MASTTLARTGLPNGAPLDTLCDYCERLLSSECVQVQEAKELGSSFYFPLREKLPDGQSVDVPNFDPLWPTSKILDRGRFRELCDPTVLFFVLGNEEELRLRTHGCHLCRLVIACLDRKILQEPLGTPGPTVNTRYAVPFFWKQEDPKFRKVASLRLFWLDVGEQGHEQTYVDCKLGLESLPSKGQDQTVCGSRSVGALSPSTLARLRSWIEECKAGHTKCIPSILAKQLPTRLVHVDKSDGQFVLKLVETQALHLKDRKSLRYSALSHCWGPTGPSLRLLENNYAELLSSIPFNGLPQTFKDAVIMSEALGLHYLWIDAMCILQDKNSPDWYQEAPLMQLVYSQAEVTLAASAAFDGTGGLFLQDYSLTPCKILPQLSNIKGFQGSWFLCNDHHTAHQRYIEDAPLNQRAWVLQERILSPRIVHFTQSQLFWECLTYEHNDCDLDFLNAELRSVPRFLSVRTPWHMIVRTYSTMKLTVPGDKLVAIGGVAEAYGMQHGLSPNDYLAGMWRSEPVQLFWIAASPPNMTEQINTGGTAIAPSWSWAACPGAVHYPLFFFGTIGNQSFKYQYRFRIRDSVIQLLGPSRFGSVGDSVLRVETNVWALTGISQSLFRLRGSNGLSVSAGSGVYESRSEGFVWDPLATSSYFLPLLTTLLHNEADGLFGLQVRPREGRKGAFSRVSLSHVQILDSEELSIFCSHAGSVDLDESLYVEKLEGGGYIIDLV